MTCGQIAHRSKEQHLTLTIGKIFGGIDGPGQIRRMPEHALQFLSARTTLVGAAFMHQSIKISARDGFRVLRLQSGAAESPLGAMRQRLNLQFELFQGQWLELFRTRHLNDLAALPHPAVPAAIGAAAQRQAAAEPALRCAQLCFNSLALNNELLHLEFFLAWVGWTES